jgi:hypothetical protein
MYKQLAKLYERGMSVKKTFRKKHTNNRRTVLVIKMLEHFNDRFTKLEKLCKETNANVLMCNLIISDLDEMLNQIEKNI